MGRSVEVGASIFNIPRSLILAGNAAQLKTATEDMGVRGLLYSVVRNTHGRGVARELVASGVAVKFQQSFVGGGIKNALVYRPIMLSLEGSLEQLALLQEVAEANGHGRRPVIVHPNEQRLDDQPTHAAIDYLTARDSGSHGPFLHQPTVETLRRWRVLWQRQPEQTAQDMLAEQETRGFDSSAVALDLNHLLAERGGRQLSLGWCMAFAGELATRGALASPGEIQLSFQPGFGGKKDHLARILANGLDEQTPHGQVVGAIAEHLPTNQEAVDTRIEVLPSDLRQAGVSYQIGNQLLVQALRESPLAA